MEKEKTSLADLNNLALSAVFDHSPVWACLSSFLRGIATQTDVSSEQLVS